MKVLVAEKCGFCPGVRNAINLAKKTLEKNNVVYSLGPIIHNEDVVRQLAETGLHTVSRIDEIDTGTVLIRSHGATLAELQEIHTKGLNVVDATCILVKRVQKIACLLYDEGYHVIIVGDRNHPEVRAVVGSAPDVDVAGTEDDLSKIRLGKKLGIICQTTQSPDYFVQMVATIARRGLGNQGQYPCRGPWSVRKRRSSCVDGDIMFVLGGLHSKYPKVAELCKNTIHRRFTCKTGKN